MIQTGTEFKVLDHGYLRLIDYMGSDAGIVEAARMSTGRGFISWDPYKRCKVCNKTDIDPTEVSPGVCSPEPGRAILSGHQWEIFPNGDRGMLDFLWRHKHTSPFEMAEIQIEVQAPIFVFREWHRHRTQSYNEFSARYAQMPNLHYVPAADRIQVQSTDNKQGSGDFISDEQLVLDIIHDIQRDQDGIYSEYELMLREGVSKEIARINTPVSRYSRMRAKTDLLNWLRFLNLRMRPNAQYEIRVYAEAMSQILQSLFPRTWELFEEYDLYATHFGRKEMQALQLMLTSKYNAIEAGKSVGLSSSLLKEFQNKLNKGGKEILT